MRFVRRAHPTPFKVSSEARVEYDSLSQAKHSCLALAKRRQVVVSLECEDGTVHTRFLDGVWYSHNLHNDEGKYKYIIYRQMFATCDFNQYLWGCALTKNVKTVTGAKVALTKWVHKQTAGHYKIELTTPKGRVFIKGPADWVWRELLC